MSKVDVKLVKDLWTRVVNKDSHGRVAQHNHAFVKVGPHNTYTQYVAGGVPGPAWRLDALSGARGWNGMDWNARQAWGCTWLISAHNNITCLCVVLCGSVVAEKVGGSVKLAVSSGEFFFRPFHTRQHTYRAHSAASSLVICHCLIHTPKHTHPTHVFTHIPQ